MSLISLDPRMMLLSLFREARIDKAVLTRDSGVPSAPAIFTIRPYGELTKMDPRFDSVARCILEKIEQIMIENGIPSFSRFNDLPPEAKFTVADAIEKLNILPPDAEMRVIEVLPGGETVNVPAKDIVFEKIGPLMYVEVI